MYCRKCGTELPENAAYCHCCGIKVEETELNNYVSYSQAQVEKKEKNNKGFVIAIVLILMAIAVAFLVVPSFVSNKEIDKTPHDIENYSKASYRLLADNPTEEEILETIKILQNRTKYYSDNSAVVKKANNQIDIYIHNKDYSEDIFDQLGSYGMLEFIELLYDTDGNVIGQSVVLDGNDIADAYIYQNEQTGGYEIGLEFTEAGKQKIFEATTRNVGKPIYICYNDEVISYPTVNEPIPNGQATINGSFTQEEAEKIVYSIRLGNLPLEIERVK